MRRFALTPWRIVLLIILFLLTALVALVVHLPAAWAWSRIEAQLPSPLPLVEVAAVGGTVWDGASLVSLDLPGAGARQARIAWDLDLLSVLTDGPGLGWGLETRQSQLDGRLIVSGSDAARLRLEGIIALAEFADIARRNGLTLPGSITVTDLELGLVDGRLAHASGLGRWDGGKVSWQMAGVSGQAQYPPLLARLGEQAGGISLDIVTEAGGEPLIDIQVSPEGMASMKVRRRLAQISGLQAGPGSPDDIVFTMQQPLAVK